MLRVETRRQPITKRTRMLPGRRPWLQLAGVLVAVVVLAIIAPAIWAYLSYRDLIYDDPGQVPSAPVAIVFGAAIQAAGTPSPMLADRVDAAVALYRSGKVQRILMSGDNSSADYDEVSVMKRWALIQGVPEEKIELDHAGVRTYDSCFRAKNVFGITDAILVSQGYHLPRALYLANSFGIKAVGLKAGLDSYPGQPYYDLREAAALTETWYEVNLTRPRPRDLGEPGVIPGSN